MSEYWPPQALRRAGRARHQDLAASEFARDRHDIQPGGAAAGDQQALARIDTLVNGDVLDRADHVIASNFHYRARGVLHLQAETRGDLRHRLRGRVGVEGASVPPRK